MHFRRKILLDRVTSAENPKPNLPLQVQLRLRPGTGEVRSRRPRHEVRGELDRGGGGGLLHRRRTEVGPLPHHGRRGLLRQRRLRATTIMDKESILYRVL